MSRPTIRLSITNSIDNIVNAKKKLIEEKRKWTDADRKKALVIAKNRAKIHAILHDSNISDVDATRLINQLEVSVTRQAIIYYRNKINLKRVNMLLDYVGILSVIEENPQITYSELAKLFSCSLQGVRILLNKAGIVLRSGRKVSLQELNARKRFYLEHNLMIPSINSIPLINLKEKYDFLLSKGFVVQDSRVLFVSLEKLKRNIDLLESLGVDWRKHELLLLNSENWILEHRDALNSIGASHELDFMMLESFIGIDNMLKYSDALNAIKNNDFDFLYLKLPGYLMKYVVRKRNLNVQKGNDVVDVIKDSVLFFLENCKYPEKNPQLSLLVLFRFCFHELEKHFKIKSLERSFDDMYETYDPDNDEIGLRRKRDD